MELIGRSEEKKTFEHCLKSSESKLIANADFTIDKAYAKSLRNKINLFSGLAANKRKNIFLTMITTFGVTDNEYAKELVQSEVQLEDLFVF